MSHRHLAKTSVAYEGNHVSIQSMLPFNTRRGGLKEDREIYPTTEVYTSIRASLGLINPERELVLFLADNIHNVLMIDTIGANPKTMGAYEFSRMLLALEGEIHREAFRENLESTITSFGEDPDDVFKDDFYIIGGFRIHAFPKSSHFDMIQAFKGAGYDCGYRFRDIDNQECVLCFKNIGPLNF